MNTRCLHPAAGRQAHALIMVMVLTGAALITLVGTLSWSRTSVNLVARNNQQIRTQVAAEAATEKIIARIGNDYQNYGVQLVNANLDSYRNTVPTAAEYSHWANYGFANESGQADRTTVDWLPLTTAPILSMKYQGLRGFAYDVRIVSLARELNTPYNIFARNEQHLEAALIPVFQYAIFYGMDLEVNPGPPMNIRGPVHCNANIYCEPYDSLTFWDQVTAAGKIILNRKPGDPSSGGNGSVTFKTPKKEKVQSLNLPLGTNNSPAAVHQIIEVPPWTESPTSLLGQLRYYNQASLIVMVSNNTVKVTSGSFNNFATVIPWSQATLFVKTNASFYDDRENKDVLVADIDVDMLRRWSATNTLLRPLLTEEEVRTVYVGNYRSASGKMAGVRLINGAWLPAKGLTVATFNPMYIKGDYNVTTNGTPSNLGSANTSKALPASIAADAITLLSTAWSDAQSSNPMTSRNANDTTMNVAILAGHSPTVSGTYGGGVHNMTRFLEDWNNRTLTLNTSIVSMFPAQSVTAPWSISYYQPPDRNWSFDINFNDPNKLPPTTPQLRVLLRGAWAD